MSEKKQVKLSPQQLLSTFSSENSKLEELNRRLNALSMGMQEINSALEGMNSVQSEKGKILVPLGAGVFLQAATEDNKKVIFSMPGGILKTKKVGEVITDLEKRKSALLKTLEKSKQEQERTTYNVNTLAGVLRQTQKRERARNV